MPIGAIILVGLVSSLNGFPGSVVHRAAVCVGLGLLHLLVEILGKSGNQCFPDFARTSQGSLSCLGAGDPVQCYEWRGSVTASPGCGGGRY